MDGSVILVNRTTEEVREDFVVKDQYVLEYLQSLGNDSDTLTCQLTKIVVELAHRVDKLSVIEKITKLQGCDFMIITTVIINIRTFEVKNDTFFNYV